MNLYLDCEFNGWSDAGTGELISMGLVSEDGQYEFYEVVGCANPNTFVAQHVMPIFGKDPIQVKEFVSRLLRFLWQVNNETIEEITIVADFPSDIELFNRVLLFAPGQSIHVPVLKFILDLSDPSQNNGQ